MESYCLPDVLLNCADVVRLTNAHINELNSCGNLKRTKILLECGMSEDIIGFHN